MCTTENEPVLNDDPAAQAMGADASHSPWRCNDKIPPRRAFRFLEIARTGADRVISGLVRSFGYYDLKSPVFPNGPNGLAYQLNWRALGIFLTISHRTMGDRSQGVCDAIIACCTLEGFRRAMRIVQRVSGGD